MTTLPWAGARPAPSDIAALKDAEPRSFWMDSAGAPEPADPLLACVNADLCIIGGGFTGLWAALHAKADDPGRDIVLLEGQICGYGGSGRNGGFCIAALTHTLENGLSRFGKEMQEIERLGADNFAGLGEDLLAHGIDCEFEPNGLFMAAVDDSQAERLPEHVALRQRFNHDVVLLDEVDARAEIASPIYRGAAWDRTGGAVLHPFKLVRGLRAAAIRAGVRIYEHTPATDLQDSGTGLEVLAPLGRVRARSVLLATNAFPPLVSELRRYVLPVYDYALMTETLSASQLESIGWRHRQGVEDFGNQFHYYRLTRDNRILFGGYDAIYRYGGRVTPGVEERPQTHAKLARHFFITFPQLEGLQFSHRWAGAIDTCSRFSVFFGSAYGGRLRYAAGYTGLGVAATRFGARVALDLLDGRETSATRLRYVRRKPVPFPPEPLRSAAVHFTRNRLGAADRAGGRRGVWLRFLDSVGLGFNS